MAALGKHSASHETFTMADLDASPSASDEPHAEPHTAVRVPTSMQAASVQQHVHPRLEQREGEGALEEYWSGMRAQLRMEDEELAQTTVSDR